MKVDFVLWDHDGVLVDSEPWFFEATRRTMLEYGVDATREDWLALQARGQGIAALAARLGPGAPELSELRRRRDDLYHELLDANDVLIDGALDVLDHVRRHHRMALVTTSLRRFVDQLHAETSLLGFFDCVITAEDCSRHKPHPEPYLLALERLGAAAPRSVAVEDSPRGLQAAVGAGLRCYVIRNDFMAGRDFSDAHAVVDSIRDLPFAPTA